MQHFVSLSLCGMYDAGGFFAVQNRRQAQKMDGIGERNDGGPSSDSSGRDGEGKCGTHSLHVFSTNLFTKSKVSVRPCVFNM